jgi:hypothetical protein
MLKLFCSGVNTSANYIAGVHFTAAHITRMQLVSASVAGTLADS